MLSNNANYNMDTALDEINQKKLLLDIKVETQLILQLLIQKGIVTREEVSEMRNKVKNSPSFHMIILNRQRRKQITISQIQNSI